MQPKVVIACSLGILQIWQRSIDYMGTTLLVPESLQALINSHVMHFYFQCILKHIVLLALSDLHFDSLK